MVLQYQSNIGFHLISFNEGFDKLPTILVSMKDLTSFPPTWEENKLTWDLKSTTVIDFRKRN
jgi:hypothetical protein